MTFNPNALRWGLRLTALVTLWGIPARGAAPASPPAVAPVSAGVGGRAVSSAPPPAPAAPVSRAAAALRPALRQRRIDVALDSNGDGQGALPRIELFPGVPATLLFDADVRDGGAFVADPGGDYAGPVVDGRAGAVRARKTG